MSLLTKTRNLQKSLLKRGVVLRDLILENPKNNNKIIQNDDNFLGIQNDLEKFYKIYKKSSNQDQNTIHSKEYIKLIY